MSARQTVLLLLLLLVVVGSGWFLYQLDEHQQQLPVSATGHDVFVNGMDLQVMDSDGQLQYHVRSDAMIHFPDQERLDLSRPVIELRRRDGTAWHITSERGQTNDAGDRIWLLGQVDIRRPASARSSGLQIQTSDLLVKPDQQIAETDNAASISAARYRVEAIGLKANFRTHQLELRSRVRGTIDGAG